MKTLTSLPLLDLLEKAARKHVFTDIALDLDAAYDDFVTALASLCDTETSLPHLMRVLCYTRLQLYRSKSCIPPVGLKKNVAVVCRKAIEMIRCEEQTACHYAERLQPHPERLTWQDSKTGLCEIIFAWQAKGSFGNIPMTRLAAHIQQVFNIDLGSNLSRTFGEMRLRNDPTPYLDSMTDALLRKMKRTKIKR